MSEKIGNGTEAHDDVHVRVSDFFPSLEAILPEQSSGDGEGGPCGVLESPDDARRRNLKAQIESVATQAARAGHTLMESCPWPFGSDEGQHFAAVFILEGGKVR